MISRSQSRYGGDPFQPAREQIGGRDLGLRIERREVACEAAHHPQPQAVVALARAGLAGPAERQLAGDPFRARLLEEGDEPGELAPGALELEPELPADPQVVDQVIVERAHAAPPPGHGIASALNAAWSTLA